MSDAAAALNPEVLGALLSRCALGDQRACAQLYRLTSAKLFGVALRILRREDWAEEVLQESFVNIWNHAAAYSVDKSAPLTWMSSIVRNRSLDWVRRPRHEETREDYDLIVENVRDEAAGPLDQLARAADAKAAPEHHACISARLEPLGAGGAYAPAAGHRENVDTPGAGAPQRLLV